MREEKYLWSVDDFYRIYECTLFSDRTGKCFTKLRCLFPKSQTYEIYQLNSPQLSSILMPFIKEHFADYEIPIALAKIFRHFRIGAMANKMNYEIPVRVVMKNKEILWDISDKENSIIKIDSAGQKIIKSNEVEFAREQGQMPLAKPVEVLPNVFLKIFTKFFRLQNNGALLILTFMVKILFRNYGENPILIITGDRKTGKNTVLKMIKRIIHPTSALVSNIPTSIESFAALTSSIFLPSYTSVTEIQEELAGLFCLLTEQNAIMAPKKYKPMDRDVFFLNQSFMLSCRKFPATTENFVQKSILVKMNPLSDHERISSVTWENEFVENLPSLLGGLCAVTSLCLKYIDQIQTSDLPSLTEFCRIGLALEKALELERGSFMSAYNFNTDQKRIESDPFWKSETCRGIYECLILLQQTNAELRGNYDDLIRVILETVTFEEVPYELQSAGRFSYFIKTNLAVLASQGILFESYPKNNRGQNVRLKLKGDFNKYAYNLL
jgi:energy-coupling factor transporter ATP-binding protein EcfA2